MNGGEGGVRTHDTVARMPVFKTGAFDHSATSPHKKTTAIPNSYHAYPIFGIAFSTGVEHFV